MLPFLAKSGWLASRASGDSIDGDGAPIPWITYPAISFLEARVVSAMDVFEFGSGNSTRWWAQRVRRVRAVEHDEAWARRLKQGLPRNASLEHVPLVAGGDYSRSACRCRDRFHIVVVDGRDRVNCALESTASLRGDGVIIWDNSERSRYKPGIDELSRRGFRQLPFRGLAPIGTWETETSILYRDGNCLGL